VSTHVRVLLLAVTIAGLMWLSACVGTKAAPGPPPPVPVLAAVVEQRDVPSRYMPLERSRRIRPVSVKTQITGELTGVFFKEGDDVQKGQLIFTLDKRPLEADVRRAEGALARTRRKAKNALSEQRRYESLVKAGVVSTQNTIGWSRTQRRWKRSPRRQGRAGKCEVATGLFVDLVRQSMGATGNLLVHQGT